LALGLTALVAGELAGLLTLFTRDEGLRPERRRVELRTRSTELWARSRVGRPRSAEAATTATTTTAATASPAARTVGVAKLRRRGIRIGRAWTGGRLGLAWRLLRGLAACLVLGPL
jgi:hypothetical protein